MPNNGQALNPRDMARRRFQAVAAETIDRQAEAIKVMREFLADQATRIDDLLKRFELFQADAFKAVEDVRVEVAGLVTRLDAHERPWWRRLWR